MTKFRLSKVKDFLIRPREMLKLSKLLSLSKLSSTYGQIDKLRFSHIKKVIQKDLNLIKKRKFKTLMKRWGGRIKRIPRAIKLLSKILFGSIILYFGGRATDRRFSRKRKIPTEIYPIRELETQDELSSVSIVINTKNSPPYFENILERYMRQVGFKSKEIIVIDSGSKDNTLTIAKKLGCKIIQIKPGEFKHGKSRNIGIDASTGEYIVNAVSDALPSTLDLLYKAAKNLEKRMATAVSVRQIPRLDADLFATWVAWRHYQTLFEDNIDDFWFEDSKGYNYLPSFEKRKNMVIDDVFVMHRAKVIKKERYSDTLGYAEDLDLSIRYAKKGLKIGFLNSEAVIHSHNRPAGYFLKRYFVDTNTLYEIFDSLPENLLVTGDFKIGTPTDDLSSILTAAKIRLSKFAQADSGWIEKYLDDLKGKGENTKLHLTWNRTFDSINESLNLFARMKHSSADELIVAQSKVAALTSGILFSEYYLRAKLEQKGNALLENLKKSLEEGV